MDTKKINSLLDIIESKLPEERADAIEMIDVLIDALKELKKTIR